MDAVVLATLEYDQIIAMLADKTSSVMGRELALALLPASDAHEVRERLAETKEAVEISAAFTSIPLGGIRDIRTIIKRAKINAVLEPAELMAVASTLYAARRLKQFFHDIPNVYPRLAAMADKITTLRNLEIAIENAINEQGNIRDDASAELLRIRREIKSSQARVKEKLDSILHSAEYQKYFQDNLITIRGDRYVMPIKQEYRHAFPGIVHDQSSSGATVFIEPMAVVNLNNDIKQLMAAEKHEIERILAMLSAKVAKDANEISQNLEAMARIDFAFAKARLSAEMKAEEPRINTEGYVRLKKARHPLIDSQIVVPIDVHLGREFTTLLITGPNTGGKTVTLKTVGLFALMTQAGLFIPADYGSEMPVFNNIFADIGDEQSIEQSLSTFSGHMTNLVRILRQITPSDLVLIDEIGAGTDPGEGAALAMAILEYMHTIGVRTIATTHYSELKTFAYLRHGIENASVEFDIQTLRPTYRLLIGIPGSSNAFAISRRLGLSAQLIDRAQELLDKDHAEFEKVLAALEEEKRLYFKKNEEIKQLEQHLASLKQELFERQRQLEDKQKAILSKAQNEAHQLLRQARRTAEETIADLKAQYSVQDKKERQQAITNARKRLRDSFDKLSQYELEDTALPEATLDELKPGTAVFVTTLGQRGTVISATNSDVAVQLGVMKVNVPISACRLAGTPSTVQEKAEKKTGIKPGAMIARVQAVKREIDVRGMTVEEAEAILEKYLDDAILAGLSEVLVIHGKGTGALRKGIRSYLKNHHHVRDIRIGEIGEGGDGVTAAILV